LRRNKNHETYSMATYVQYPLRGTVRHAKVLCTMTLLSIKHIKKEKE